MKQHIYFVTAKDLMMASLIKSLTAKEHGKKILDGDSLVPENKATLFG